MARHDPDGSTGELLGALSRWLPALLPDPVRAARLLAVLRDAAPDEGKAVDADCCARLTRAGRRVSRGLTLAYVGDGSPAADAGPAPPVPTDPAVIRRHAAAVTGVRRDADGFATVRLDGLAEVGTAAPYVDAALALTHGCRGLLLDLRGNAGGDPATAALVIGWLLGGARVQLATIATTDGERPLWTPGLRADRELAALPVAALTGPATRGYAEGLAYHLRARRRATIVGEPTAGVADQLTDVRLTRQVRGTLPSGHVRDARTGGNWEGAGVTPDLPCPARRAPAHARDWLAAR